MKDMYFLNKGFEIGPKLSELHARLSEVQMNLLKGCEICDTKRNET